MAKAVRKRIATIKHVTTDTEEVTPVVTPAPVQEPELAPDAKPIQLSLPPNPQMKEPVYSMVCWAGEYKSSSWIGLGWTIFKHRAWHLIWHGSFTD